MDASPPERTAPLRTEDSSRSSEVVGVTEVDFLGYPTACSEYSLGMRRDIARAIRRRRPDAVLVGSWDVEFAAVAEPGRPPVAGLATADAVRDAGNRWVFPNCSTGPAPHAARWLIIAGDPAADPRVDVTGEPLERGIAALEAHAQYLPGSPAIPRRMMLTGITR